MDKAEAHQVLTRELTVLRRLPYGDLVERFLDRSESKWVTADSGARYQLELQAFWDDPRNQTLRVVAAIDDGGWRALKPLTEGFIIASDGPFVGN
jgi:hypothetical protein